jgi:hypothetical protein
MGKKNRWLVVIAEKNNYHEETGLTAKQRTFKYETSMELSEVVEALMKEHEGYMVLFKGEAIMAKDFDLFKSKGTNNG